MLSKSIIPVLSLSVALTSGMVHQRRGESSVFEITYGENIVGDPELGLGCYDFSNSWFWGEGDESNTILRDNERVDDVMFADNHKCLTVRDGYMTSTPQSEGSCGQWITSAYWPERFIDGEPVVFLKYRASASAEWQCFVKVDDMNCEDGYSNIMGYVDSDLPKKSRFRMVDCETDNQAEFVLQPRA